MLPDEGVGLRSERLRSWSQDDLQLLMIHVYTFPEELRKELDSFIMGSDRPEAKFWFLAFDLSFERNSSLSIWNGKLERLSSSGKCFGYDNPSLSRIYYKYALDARSLEEHFRTYIIMMT